MLIPRHSPVLAELTNKELERLLRRAVSRHLEGGDILFLAGDEAERMYVVEDGVFKFIARDDAGAETILGLAIEGDLIGEVAVLGDSLQPVDAVAATACDVTGFDAETLVELTASNGKAALELARGLARKTRWLSDAALERTSGEVPQRLAARLLDLADLLGRVRGSGIELELPLAQKDLGRLAGMCRESACKAMREFQSQGVIEYRGRQLRIHRPDLLHKIRCSGRARPMTKSERTETSAKLDGGPFRWADEGGSRRSRARKDT
jgi:CRP-like cAMP-binding protein